MRLARARPLAVLLIAVSMIPCGQASLAASSNTDANSSYRLPGLWSLRGVAGQEWVHCCNFEPPMARSSILTTETSVCLDESALGHDLIRVLVRRSPEVNQPVRILTSECNVQGMGCLAEIWNHSIPTAGSAEGKATDFVPLPVGQIRVPVTLVRPGEHLRGVVFARMQKSQYHNIFTKMNEEQLEHLKLVLRGTPTKTDAKQSHDDSPHVVYSWRGKNTSAIQTDSLIPFDLPLSKFWTPG